MPELHDLLERRASGYQPSHDLFERVLDRRARRHRNQRIAAGVLGIAVFALAAIGFVRLLGSEGTPASDPQSPFAGTWVSVSDADGGTQTMIVSVSPDGVVEIVVTDDVATVCGGSPSTMTGTGRIDSGTQFVIPSPVYTCDDGSEPETLSGPPLQEQLRDWTLFLDPETDTLSDGVGGVWVREGAEVPSPGPAISGTTWWPQTNLDEVQEAQELADAGDPDYTWQVDPTLASYGNADIAEDPLKAEIFERFIREEIGWEEFSGFAIGGYQGTPTAVHLEGVLFIRCAPGRTNPLAKTYPGMPPEVRGCAPTIDDSRWETVRFNVDQQGLIGPAGVWVVTGWELLQPGEPYSTFDHLYPDFDQSQVEQTAPPSDAEVTALLQAFLGARVDGEGAERYVHRHPDAWDDQEVPILYATTGGSPYERYEFDRLQGPVWPTGWIEFRLRLFAEDGTVVEQSFVVIRQEDGRLGLVYGSPNDPIPTTEDGQAVPVPYRILDGEVTFAAAPPWSHTSHDRTSTTLGGVGRGSAVQFTMFTVAADPVTGVGCEAGPVAADAEALVRSIRSNPDLEATAPVPASVGGIGALRMDVVGPGQLDVGACSPMVLEGHWLGPDGRMRVYVLDLPEGMSARTLAIAINALDSEFERVVKAAEPVLDSFEFHAP
jgi:hypothetical protein